MSVLRPGSFIHRRGYTQPRYAAYNRNDPICKGLRAFYLLNDGIGTQFTGPPYSGLIDSGPQNFSGQPFSGLNNSTGYVASHHGGLALSFAGAGNGTVASPNQLGCAGASPRSWVVWARQTSIANTVKTIVMANTAVATLQQCGIYVSVIAQGDIYLGFNGRDLYTSPVFSTGVWGCVIFTYNGGLIETVGSVKCYFNGIQQTLLINGSSTGALNTSGVNNGIGVGYDPMTVGRGFLGGIEGLRFYDRELSPLEALRLSSEPYAGLLYGPSGIRGVPLFIRGTVREGFTPVSGRTLRLYDGTDGTLVDTTTSAGDGTYALAAGTRSNVYAMAFDPTTYQAQIQDQLVPVP